MQDEGMPYPIVVKGPVADDVSTLYVTLISHIHLAPRPSICRMLWARSVPSVGGGWKYI